MEAFLYGEDTFVPIADIYTCQCVQCVTVCSCIAPWRCARCDGRGLWLGSRGGLRLSPVRRAFLSAPLLRGVLVVRAREGRRGSAAPGPEAEVNAAVEVCSLEGVPGPGSPRPGCWHRHPVRRLLHPPQNRVVRRGGPVFRGQAGGPLQRGAPPERRGGHRPQLPRVGPGGDGGGVSGPPPGQFEREAVPRTGGGGGGRGHSACGCRRGEETRQSVRSRAPAPLLLEALHSLTSS